MALPTPPTLDHCYRHPDRETGRQCTRCGRPACGECLVSASIGSHCLDCVKSARPDMRTRARFWNARQPTLVTYVLIALNVAIYVWVLTGTSRQAGFVSSREADLGIAAPLLEQGDWYRLITSGFLHFSVLHIAMNMLLLFQLGQMLEPALGRVRFGLVYFASLLGGSAGAIISNPDVLTGGASGAVFGLMAAAAVGMKQRGINPFSTGLGTILILNLVLTFTLNNVSKGGHVGGAIAGALCALVVMAPRWRQLPVWTTYAAPAAVGFVAVVLAYVTA